MRGKTWHWAMLSLVLALALAGCGGGAQEGAQEVEGAEPTELDIAVVHEWTV